MPHQYLYVVIVNYALTFVTITFNYRLRSLVKTVNLIMEMGYVNDIPAVSILGPEILSQGRKLLLADYA